MRCILLALALALNAAQAAPPPTVIIDIHDRGRSAVVALTQESSVLWNAEFGNELLLGVDPEHLGHWLTRDGVRMGPPRLAFDEVVVRDHVCTLHDSEPAIAVVGGYEILRKPAMLARATRGPLISGEPLPAGGIVAQEVNNQAQRVAKGALDPDVVELTAAVDGDRWFETVSALAGFDRNSFNPNLDTAHDWILAQFSVLGLQPQSFPFQLSGASGCTPPLGTVDLSNPIGVKPGADLADEWVVVGAHYDSRNSSRCDGIANPQPGANDNGTGCAGVIELARALRSVDTRRSILFMCFAGEEQGLVGSRRYVESLQASGEISKVRYMINLDMIGYADSDALSARVETTANNIAQLSRFAQAAADYAPELNLITSSSTQAYSDHWYFLNAGVPGVFSWENGAGIYPQYHQQDDLPQNLLRGRELASGILKMDLAILAEEALLVPPLFRDSFEAP